MRTYFWVTGVLVTALWSTVAAGIVRGEEEPEKPEPAANTPSDKNHPAENKDAKEGESKPPAPTGPLTIKKRPFKVELHLDGNFVPTAVAEYSVQPREWAQFTITKVVENGRRVKKGEPLITYDTRALDNEIAELEAGRELSKLALAQAEEDLKLSTQLAPLDLAAAQRSHKEAQEDYEYFLKTGRSSLEKRSEFMVKAASQTLEGAQEELKQLEKMYKADDLLEETEEIILKRAKQDVEFAQFRLELAKQDREQTMQYDLPRADKTASASLKSKDLARLRAELTLPSDLEKKRLAIAKTKFDLQNGDNKLTRLKADREQMNVAAPLDGVVYYGRFARGKSTAQAVEPILRGGGQALPHEVLLTVVGPGETTVRASLPAKKLGKLHKDQQGLVVPVNRPDARLAVKVSDIGPAPAADGSFDVALVLDDPLAPGLVPSLGCSVRFRLYAKEDAISVPAAAVFTDELDDLKKYVYLVTEDDKSERRTVMVGQSNDERIEITAGLVEGDKILTERPADE